MTAGNRMLSPRRTQNEVPFQAVRGAGMLTKNRGAASSCSSTPAACLEEQALELALGHMGKGVGRSNSGRDVGAAAKHPGLTNR